MALRWKLSIKLCLHPMTIFPSYVLISNVSSLYSFQAFLIAFTSDFIQKLVYKYEYGELGKMDDYVMFTLSRSPNKNWIDRGQVGVESNILSKVL